jgi:hypothetical protein
MKQKTGSTLNDAWASWKSAKRSLRCRRGALSFWSANERRWRIGTRDIARVFRASQPGDVTELGPAGAEGADEFFACAEEDGALLQTRIDPNEASIHIERDAPNHAEHARHPCAHLFSESCVPLAARDEKTYDRDLGEGEVSFDAGHLGVGKSARAGGPAFNVVNVASDRGGQHRQERRRIFRPPWRREFSFAHGAVSELFQELEERSPRRPFRKVLDGTRISALKNFERFRITLCETCDREEPQAWVCAFDIADAARERLRDLRRLTRR